MTDHDQHTLSGAYALDALDGEERARFEAHLATCADCREEVASLQEAAALLGTDDVVPPSSVRDSVLAGIASIRPLPPLPVPTADAGPAAHDELAARRTQRSLAQRLARTPLLVAAAVVLLLAVGTAVVRPWGGETPGGGPSAPTAEEVLAASDATTVEKAFPDGSRAVVTVSREEAGAVIKTIDMAHAPEGKDYQLWFLTPAGEFQPAGLMPDISDATKLLEGDASRATGVGITVEPDGGSKQPTTDPIAVFNLEA
ncbi:MAG TPA: anti-sigma factor [Nocardioides sp.]|nr:anti-sigma factor [Nocardioides sp.]